MGRNKRGADGYRSFGYLTPGEDYPPEDLVEDAELFPAHPVPLSAEEEVRAERLAGELVLISLHEHLGSFPRDIHRTPAYVREGRVFTPFAALAGSDWDCVFDNLLDGICRIESRTGWKWNEVLHDLGMRLADIAHQDFLIHCRTVDDILRAHAEGRIAWVAAIEGAAPIENELDRVEVLHGFGVREMGITYSESNALGSGLKEANDGGLTAFGHQVVERMNKVGMLIDTAHCGDQTTLDVIAASEKPVSITHIGARSLWNTRRMAPDDVLKACADKGGIIGIEAAPHTTLTKNHPRHNLESFMEHFEYVKDLVGVDYVGFGPDTVFGDHVGLHGVYSAALSIKKASAGSGAPAFDRVPYVAGIENPVEGSKNILRWLVKHGYSDEDVGKVMGGNALRVLREVWA